MKSGGITLKTLINKYKHAWVLIYFPLYMLWFTYLEKSITTKYTNVHIAFDDYIPFNEWFIIPYYMWFLFIIVIVAYLFLKDIKEYYRCTAFLFIGMSICLLIYTIWPNGQNLRPDLSLIGRENVALRILSYLYRTDTNTNICPSIHVFNSVGVCIGIFHSKNLRQKKYITIPSLILAVLICLSTVFLKQHSSFDVICAIILSIVMYISVYIPDYCKIYKGIKQYYTAKYKLIPKNPSKKTSN